MNEQRARSNRRAKLDTPLLPFPVRRPPALRLLLGKDDLLVDNFAGGGGASQGFEEATGRSPDIAVNHDPTALAMHEANHPKTQHLCESVWDVDPVRVCAGRHVRFAWFSPDCTYHSKARGAKPFRDRKKARRRRGLAYVAVRWAATVRPDVICIENVEEFANWGPLGSDNLPDPAKRGSSFRRWKKRLENLGYVVDMRELRACDYGAPTIRKRLFIIARCDGRPIVWPEPTHGPGCAEPHRAAAEIIDWNLPSKSIFGRKRPLAAKTLARIARGLKRFVIESKNPYIVPLRGTSDAHKSVHSIDDPLSTISAGGTHHGLVDATLAVAPFITEHANGSRQRNMRADEPLRTICANVKGGHFGAVAATLVETGNGEREGQAPRARDIEQPYWTVTAKGSQGGVAEAHLEKLSFLARHFGRKGTPGNDLAKPMGAITSRDHTSLVDVELAPDLTPEQLAGAERVYAFMVKFYGNEKEAADLDRPIGTVTTKDRFALITVRIRGVPYVIVDITMRMLHPRELFNAQGFPPGYKIDCKRPLILPKKGQKKKKQKSTTLSRTEQVHMCGNAVSPKVAAAIIRANLNDSRMLEAA